MGNPIRKEVVIGNARLLLGDCLQILPTLGKVDAVVTDPPYGIEGTWRGGNTHGWGKFSKEAESWDKRPSWLADWLSKFGGSAIVWGGQYLDLPASGSWLIWDKIVREFTSGHAELAWTNLGKPIRAFNFSHGSLASEGKLHPTQKPLALICWCLGFIPDAEIVLDPFMGSGTTGVACAKLGRSFIGIEIDEGYFDIACRRIQDAYDQPDMFITQPRSPAPIQQPLFGDAAE